MVSAASQTAGLEVTERSRSEEVLALVRDVRRLVDCRRALGVETIVKRPRSTASPSPLPLPGGERAREGGDHPAAGLAALRAHIGDCTRCALHQGRRNLVFGVGNPRARLMFVGEGPGEDEDRQGEPFVGKAGQLLNRMIQAMGLTREAVYIANVVKCRPPGNRTPAPDEIATCRGFLERQIEILRPEVICALGSVAAQTLLSTGEKIGRLRGRFWDLGGIPVLPTYHPAYLLRNPAEKKKVWEDLQHIMTKLGLTR